MFDAVKYKNTQIALGKAGKELRRRMRQSLSQPRFTDSKGNRSRNKNASGSLSKSLSYEQYVDKRYGPRLIMTGDSYATFVDQGVTGTGRDLKEGETVARSRSNYAFKRSKKSIDSSVIERWMGQKGLRGRDPKTGRFLKKKSSAFLIARAIHRRGLQPTGFIEDTVKRYEPEMFELVGEALAKDGAEYLVEKLNVAFKK